MAEPAPTLDAAQVDFLYWHAVSKMRMADFEGAGVLFRLLHAACPARADVALGRVYCLLRMADYDSAAGLVTALRRRPLNTEEMGLLGRMQRRCEFERSRAATRQRAVQRAAADAVVMPHTLGDDAMARRAAERRGGVGP
jgi:hypothetical protein